MIAAAFVLMVFGAFVHELQKEWVIPYWLEVVYQMAYVWGLGILVGVCAWFLWKVLP